MLVFFLRHKSIQSFCTFIYSFLFLTCQKTKNQFFTPTEGPPKCIQSAELLTCFAIDLVMLSLPFKLTLCAKDYRRISEILKMFISHSGGEGEHSKVY